MTEPLLTALQSRIAALEQQAELKHRIEALEQQAAKLRSYLAVASALAIIFGIGGGIGYRTLSNVEDKVASTATAAKVLEQSVGNMEKSLSEKAASAVQSAARNAGLVQYGDRVSFESTNYEGQFLRHRYYKFILGKKEGNEDGTWQYDRVLFIRHEQ